jgi:hypothetical protein
MSPWYSGPLTLAGLGTPTYSRIVPTILRTEVYNPSKDRRVDYK